VALTAKQAKCLAFGLPALAVAIAIGAIAQPAIRQATQQTGNSERDRQMTAIAKDIIAKRCYETTDPITKGNPVQTPAASLHSSCISGNGWFGYLAVFKGQVTTVEVFTETEIKNVLSQLKKEPK
jgi:hypothetical protein